MSGPRLIVGSTVQYICNKGYSLSGNSLLSCYHRDSTGPKWSEKLPKCIGEYKPTDTIKWWFIIKLFCLFMSFYLKIYPLLFNNILRDFFILRCDSVFVYPADSYEPCRNPGTPAYSIQSSEKHVYQAGETVRFSCLNGYQLQGEPVLRCVPGHPSKWSHPPPLCKGRVRATFMVCALHSIEFIKLNL